MPRIKLTTPDGSKLEFELDVERATVGRAEGNDIVVPDGSVSSRHGEILLKGDSIELVDLGSTNGTYVGGERIERATIAPGGTFKLGSVEGVLIAAAPARKEADGEEAQEPATETEERSSGSSAQAAPAVVTGLGATPCPVRDRKGFGPKVKKTDRVASLLIAIGVLSLLVCTAAIFLIHKMGV